MTERTITDGIHTCNDQCQRLACVAVRESYEAGRKEEVSRIVNLLSIQHEAAQGRHNYWLAAARLVQGESA